LTKDGSTRGAKASFTFDLASRIVEPIHEAGHLFVSLFLELRRTSNRDSLSAKHSGLGFVNGPPARDRGPGVPGTGRFLVTQG